MGYSLIALTFILKLLSYSDLTKHFQHPSFIRYAFNHIHIHPRHSDHFRFRSKHGDRIQIHFRHFLS